MTDCQLTQTTTGTRKRECKNCGVGFEYLVRQGGDKRHCSKQCRHEWSKKNKPPKSSWDKCECGTTVRSSSDSQCNRCYTLSRKEKAGVCHVHKCKDPATRVGEKLCEKHYYRKRRTGTTDTRALIGWYKDGHGYIHKWEPEHPLSKKSGYVSEHRRVVYNQTGAGSKDCYWCGKSMEWGSLHIDHIDENKENNGIENLAISCAQCNTARSAMLRLIRRSRVEVRDILKAEIRQAFT